MKHFHQYKFSLADIPASIVVFLVALPLCLGVAVASDALPITGIIAGIAGGIVTGFLSKSHLSVSGPAAGLTAIVSGALGKLPSYEVFLLSVVLAGVFQIILGLLKAGIIGDFIPNSVIKGMLAAIGIILILKQIPHFLGYDADPLGDESFLQKDKKIRLAKLLKLYNIPQQEQLSSGLRRWLFYYCLNPGKSKNKSCLPIYPGPSLLLLFAF